MMRRAWWLPLGLCLLPGCARHRVSDDVMGNLTAQVHDIRPGQPVDPPPSPYQVRGTDPGGEEPASLPDSQVKRSVHVPERPTLTSTPPLLKESQEPPGSPPPEQTSKVKKPKPEDPLVACVRLLREDRPERARERLKVFDPATRNVLSLLLPVLARLAEPGRAADSPRDCAALLDQLESLARSLRPEATLGVDKMCFCRRIEKYGVYDPLPATHVFQVGGEGRPGDLVQVYVELKNFASVKNGPYHETTLACTLQICDEQHRIVWRQDRPAQVERSLSPRHDGHLACHFYVPPRLPVGDYTLWIIVKDLSSSSAEGPAAHRTAQRSLSFRVRGQRMAQVAGEPGA